MRTTIAAAAAAAALLAVPAVAAAHVTVNPKEAPAGYAKLDVRVPNERDDASTVKVVLQMPPGIVSASYEPMPGWTTRVATRRLATPIQTPHGDEVSEAIDTITWTGTGRGEGRIAPGQFRDFGISVPLPGQAGDVLTFKALQTYSSGEVVRWIGAPDSDQPAPQVTVTATGDAHGAGAPTTAPAQAGSGRDGGGRSDTLAIVALVVGALGLLAGGAALAVARGRVRPAAR
jgi:uncharacterized protein